MTRYALAALVCVGLALSGALVHAAEPAPSTPAPVAVDPEIDGIKLGEDAAAVLARLKLHPPGWARQPGAASEGRQFTIDGKRATLLIIFDKTIQEIAVSTTVVGSQVVDGYGVKLGGSLTDLIAARGAPIAIVKDGSTYIYGDTGAIRWEYEVRDGKIDAIRVSDCRIPGVCDALQDG